MPKIHVLPEHVANQIAAGEVVERPAAVIKELVENSLDAGARRIEIEFREGGRSLLRVEDDGAGMSAEDAVLALERHATSKIAQAADLDRLTTFGFRGEALPSIASVSRFLLRTRPPESETGTEILVNGGKVVHVRECGKPVGTSIEVAHLFHPVPARRKFLKSDATESAHITQCVRLYALAHPRVAFTLIDDGRIVFRSPKCPSLAERVGEIFGRQLAEALLPIDVAESGLRLHGLIGRPGISRSNRHETITFVNGRPVDSRALNFSLAEGYQESIPKGRYPLAFVFFECDPAAVDVNVPPAKREVRFRSENTVRSFVVRSVLRTLRALGGGAAPAPAAVSAFALAESGAKFGEWAAPPALERRGAALAPASPPPPATSSPGSLPAAAPAWKLLGQAHGTYSVFETPAGLVLLDRKAAGERIWFERLQDQFRSGAVPSQRLLLPVPVELDPIASALLRDRREFLQAHGFEIGEFGGRFFRIQAVPAWMEPSEAEAFLRDLLGAMRDGQLGEKNLDLAREQLARLAAARAARPDALPGEAQIRRLLAELFATRSPLASPAGRPTFIEIPHHELARRFEKG